MLKGWLGEKGVQLGLWVWLPKDKYPRIHDVIVPDNRGTTQIDHIMVSTCGIFVIETKNYNGWIFGDEYSRKWTQMFPNGKKFQFQNPLRQNYRHVAALECYLNIPKSKIHGLVVFIGDATLKSQLPSNVMSGGHATYIKSFSRREFTAEEAGEIFKKLQDLKNNPVATKREHVKNLRVGHKEPQYNKNEAPTED